MSLRCLFYFTILQLRPEVHSDSKERCDLAWGVLWRIQWNLSTECTEMQLIKVQCDDSTGECLIILFKPFDNLCLWPLLKVVSYLNSR